MDTKTFNILKISHRPQWVVLQTAFCAGQLSVVVRIQKEYVWTDKIIKTIVSHIWLKILNSYINSTVVEFPHVFYSREIAKNIKFNAWIGQIFTFAFCHFFHFSCF